MQEKNARKSNQARTKATRDALTRAARALFVEKGYADTATPEIVKSAGVTRGALYHHFADKADLFRTVVRTEFETVEREINASTVDAEMEGLDALLSGSLAYLSAMQEPGRVRILLLDGPAVLGRLEIDAIDQETSADSLRIGLREAMNAGAIRSLPLDPLTAQLSALFDRAALGVAAGDEPEQHMQVIEHIFRSLQVP